MNFTRLSFLFLLSALATSAATLSGTVRDRSGAVIASAHIVVHWDASGSNYLKDNIGVKQDVTLTTDSNGHFSIDLPPGFYDIFVSATAFSPSCEKVRIKREETKNLDARLKLSPVTSKELD
jgi:hypothetical protein